MGYDSEVETRKHIAQVGEYLLMVIRELTMRIEAHDSSKLGAEEKPIFDKYTPKLAGSTYGSAEYKEYLRGMGVALDHHYANNSHHPEHYKTADDYASVVGCMNLVDIIEMLCDWKAATLRHNDGDIYESIEINQKRFGYSNDLKSILRVTARSMGF